MDLSNDRSIKLSWHVELTITAGKQHQYPCGGEETGWTPQVSLQSQPGEGSWLWGSSWEHLPARRGQGAHTLLSRQNREPPIQTSSQAGRKLRKPLSFLSPCGLFQTPVGNKSPSEGKKPFPLGTWMRTRFPHGGSPRLYQRAEIILLSLGEMQPRETKTLRVRSWGPFLFTALRRNP